MNKFIHSIRKFFQKGSKTLPIETLERIKILMVEDNAINQFIAVSMLKKANCIPDIANDGKEALRKIKENHYDVILMDVNMPVMDGYETTKIIRQKFPKPVNQIPIIALTSYLIDEEEEKYLAFGMNDSISKPLVLNELIKKIEKSIAVGIETKSSIQSNMDPVNNSEPEIPVFSK
jgi:CheY-like chemotaxis protein